MPSTCSTQAGLQSITSASGAEGAAKLLHQHLLELQCAGKVSVRAGWGRGKGEGRQAPGLAAPCLSPGADKPQKLLQYNLFPQRCKEFSQGSLLLSPLTSAQVLPRGCSTAPGPLLSHLPHGCPQQLLLFPAFRAQVMWGCLQAPRAGGWMASQPTRGVVPAVKAIKTGIWVQKPGGGGQPLHPFSVTESTALENQCWHPCRAWTGPSCC